MLKIDIPEEKIKSNTTCIYSISNTINNKIYIGQTVNLRSRVSDYRNATHRQKYIKRLLGADMLKYGDDNFVMTIVEECKPSQLDEREEYYISKFNATNPSKGYNILASSSKVNSVESRKRKSLSHMGLKESASTKRKKSNMIMAIQNDILIVSESGKLFGDYVGCSKDYVKNCLRQPSKCKGWRLYYDDYFKRQEIRDKMLKKRSIRDLQYMVLLDFLDRCELYEGVETIYETMAVYVLSYDNIDDQGKVIIKPMIR